MAYYDGGYPGTSDLTCPNCGDRVAPDDLFCVNCGFDLSRTPVPIVPVNETCPYCGAVLDLNPGDRFCNNCGREVRQSGGFGNGHDYGWHPDDPLTPAMSYNVDIVMCIDATGSMKPIIETVKSNALSFYDDLTRRMQGRNNEKSKHINALRVKVIVFRDYLADGKDAMLATRFYRLPSEAAEFERVVQGITAKGGGDLPEDGLEALGYAIRSDWTREGDKRRHIIVVWTDDATHELGHGRSAENYPSAMARDFDELTEWWGYGQSGGLMDDNAKRLLIFAPDAPYWNVISSSWDDVMHFPSVAGQGLRELEYEEILDSIYNSL